MNHQELIIWAAGFIDADGTITIKRVRRGKKGNWNYIPYISCNQVESNQSRKVVKTLKRLFDGNIYRWQSNQKWKMYNGQETIYPNNPTLNWQITSKAATECLSQIKPYLVLKTNQSRILDEFIEKFYRGVSYRAHRLSDSERRDRQVYFEQLTAFNGKGKLKAPSTTERSNTER